MKNARNDLLLELHVPDFSKVKRYYRRLGFKVVWERKPEKDKGYLVMRWDNTILCFSFGNEEVYKLQPYFKRFPRTTKRGYGVEIVVMVDDIEDFYNRDRKFVTITERLRMQPWGLKDFRVVDPFGFYIRFTEYHNILSPNNAIT